MMLGAMALFTALLFTNTYFPQIYIQQTERDAHASYWNALCVNGVAANGLITSAIHK